MDSVNGIIAVAGRDGKYMRVTDNNGLEFGSQTLDDKSKFNVNKMSNNKVKLVEANGQAVSMYGINNITCDGHKEGVELGMIGPKGGLVNFTVFGYQGMGERTKYLSSDAGDPLYGGSLTLKDFDDSTFRFSIQQL